MLKTCSFYFLELPYQLGLLLTALEMYFETPIRSLERMKFPLGVESYKESDIFVNSVSLLKLSVP